jgi:hypothetical protein
MKLTRFLAAISLALFATAARADYTTLNWGIDRTATPYNIGVNLGGVWYPFGSISAGGNVGGGVYSGTSAPTSPILYQWWLDKSSAPYALKIFDGAQWPTLARLDATAHYWVLGSTPITNFGSPCNDATLTAAAASKRAVVIPSSITCSVSDNLTLTQRTPWFIEEDATISVAAGVTLTFSGGAHIDAGRYQIFTGAGTVRGLSFPKPEWWDGGDTAAAIQAAHDSAKYAALNWSAVRASRYGVDLGCKIYTINKTLNLSPTTNFPLKFVSECGSSVSGTYFQVAEAPGFTGTAAIDLIAPASGLDQFAQFEIGGFHVTNNSTYSVSDGLRIGKDAGTTFNPPGKNLVHDIAFDNFVNAVHHRNGRLFSFERISSFSTAPGAMCYRAHPTSSSGSVVGDVELTEWNCVPCRVAIASCSNTGNIALVADAPGTGVTGVRLHSFIGYYSNRAIYAEASNGSAITDFWVDSGSQFDGANDGGVVKNGAIAEFYATGTGSVVQNINIANIYARASHPTFAQYAFRFYADNAAAAGTGINSVNLSSPWISNAQAGAVWLNNVKGANVDAIIDSSGSAGQTAVVVSGASSDVSIRLNAQTCTAPFVYDYGVIVQDTSDRVKVLPSVLSSCVTNLSAVSSSGTQIDVSGLYPKNAANGPIVADSTGRTILPGDVELPSNGSVLSNLYYNGGWKYRGNGYGGIIQFSSATGGFNAYTVPLNSSGPNAAATLTTALTTTWDGVVSFAFPPIFTTLTGYLKGNGSSAVTAATTIPSADFADGNTGTGNVVHTTSPTIATATLTTPKLSSSTVAALPTCNAGAEGTISYVTDANAPTYNATLTGGGAVKTLAVCDGSNWTAH